MQVRFNLLLVPDVICKSNSDIFTHLKPHGGYCLSVGTLRIFINCDIINCTIIYEREYKMKQSNNTNWSFKGILRLIVTLAAILGIIFLMLSLTNPSKTPATAEQVETVLKKQGFEVVDTTKTHKEQLGENMGYTLTSSTSVFADDIEFTFYVFADDNSAEKIRGVLQSWIWENRFSVPNVEFSEAHGNYVAYTLKAHGMYSLNVRVGNTLVFAISDEESAPKILDIMAAIGYFEE